MHERSSYGMGAEATFSLSFHGLLFYIARAFGHCLGAIQGKLAS